VNPLLFIIVTDAVAEAGWRELPWAMLYADDLIIAEDSAANLQTRLNRLHGRRP